jgi:medium-chain acyl-[acyl-carrier-protein] hydrolase
MHGEPVPRVRLFCFPHAGGGASSFNGWRRALPAWIEVIRVQLPGREDRRSTPAYTRIDDLVPDLFEAMQSLLDRRIALYGHSMGGLVAFELARVLRRNGCSLPLALFVSGRRAPHKPVSRERLLHPLPEQQLLRRLDEIGTDLASPLSSFLASSKRRQHYLPTIRADLSVSDDYVYHDEEPLDCPVHAFLGVNDVLTFRKEWESWSEVAVGEFGRYLLPGGHFFSSAGQAALLAKITEVLARLVEG